jgi:ubiquinone/menaquinone biosynthesis C-methylase UbiE
VAGNEQRSRGRRRPPDTSWDRVAGWYDGWVGSRGSAYHRAVAVPTVLDLLQPQPGESIIDIGAGQGVLAPSIAEAGGRYTGIEASSRLVALARRRHGHLGRFLLGDAARIPSWAAAERATHDAAVFLFSIQDMDPLEPVVASAAWTLRRRSRIVILMTHPAFRVPRHSGWGLDPSRKLVYRRLDAYLSPMAVPMKALAGEPPTRSFHRPLGRYVEALAANGFLVDALLELPDLPSEARPGGGRRSVSGNLDIPLFLGLRAIRM